MPISRICLVLALLLSPALALPQAAQSNGANTTLHITSRIVYVDVVVRDRAGHIVRGLTEKDFRLLEGGKPQAVAFFADHTHDAPPAPTPPPSSKLAFSNVGSTSNAVNIILFDFYNTSSQDQPYARKQMIRFLEALPPGHQTALFVLGTRLHMLQTFTGSTDRLVAAARNMKLASSTEKTTGEQQRGDDFEAAFAAAVGRSASPRNAVNGGHDLGDAEELQSAINITGEALNEIAAAVSGYTGRKNLYWLADRFPLFGGPALEIHELANNITLTNLNLQQGGGLMKNIPGIMSTQDMAEANQAVADAQIAVYPISLIGVDAGGMGPDARGSTSAQQLFQARTALHDMMDNLADTTGGRAYYGTNDFADALQKGFEDGSHYYTLAYIPQNHNWNGGFRKIKIQPVQHGYSLTYRRGYYATSDKATPENPAQDLNAALQPTAPESTMIRLSSKVTMPDKQRPYVVVDSAVDPAGIDFTPDAAGVRHGKLLVLLVALPVGAALPASPPQSSGTLHLDFTPEQYRDVLKNGIRFEMRLSLKPGNYRLRLGATDMNNHRTGTLDMPIQVGP